MMDRITLQTLSERSPVPPCWESRSAAPPTTFGWSSSRIRTTLQRASSSTTAVRTQFNFAFYWTKQLKMNRFNTTWDTMVMSVRGFQFFSSWVCSGPYNTRLCLTWYSSLYICIYIPWCKFLFLANSACWYSFVYFSLSSVLTLGNTHSYFLVCI